MNLPTEFMVHVAGTLERLGIPYHVGGSVASSAHGMYRASADVDFVIDPTPGQLEALARILDAEFYVSRPAMAEALLQRSTFNAIHDSTSFKIGAVAECPIASGRTRSPSSRPCADSSMTSTSIDGRGSWI